MLEITIRGLKSDNERILEIVPVFRTVSGDTICLPSVFYPFDGRLIGLSEDFPMLYPYEGWVQGGTAYLPADNSSMSARLEFRFRVLENMEAMRPMGWNEIVGDILNGKFVEPVADPECAECIATKCVNYKLHVEEHNGKTPAGQSETETL